MRDQWYGDKRDVVKWAALVHLSETHRIHRVVQVAFYRPTDTPLRLDVDFDKVPLPKAVLDHFRNLEQIRGLAEATGLQIDVFKEPFQLHDGFAGHQAFREYYIDQVVTKLSSYHRVPLIAFLDPDTGIAPKRAGYKHVRPEEIRTIYDALKPGDVLAIYQHARRARNWLQITRQAFAEAIHVTEGDVNTITCCNMARDVAFFAAQKRAEE